MVISRVTELLIEIQKVLVCHRLSPSCTGMLSRKKTLFDEGRALSMSERLQPKSPNAKSPNVAIVGSSK